MPDNALEVQPNAQLAQYQEQNVSMVQQREKAKIESRYIMATRFPRDIEVVRQKMLTECQRPTFCAPDLSKNGSSVAIYRVPRGGSQIQGPTIRFAEMAKRCYGHIFVEVTPLGEDETQQIFQVESTDYQNNDGGSEIVSVPKRIERSYAKDTDTVLGQRTNSKGKPVYTIVPTDDDLAVKRNALTSKARRNVIMQCIDGWLVQECISQIRKTAADKDAKDPAQSKREIFDAFSSIGVTAEMLNAYIGHSNPLSPAELDELRSFFGGIKEGYTTWAEIAANKGDGEDRDEEVAKIDELMKQLEYTPAQVRTKKAKYAGRGKELLEWLHAEVAKKQNTGGKKEPSAANPTGQAGEQQQSGPAATSATASSTQTAGRQSQGSPSSETRATSENLDAEPEPQQDTKPSPAAKHHPAPPADDDEY